MAPQQLQGARGVAVASAVSLNVDDVSASSAFLVRADAGMNVIYLQRGLTTLPEDQRDNHAAGLILAFTVDDLDGELARLESDGIAISMPLIEEDWGERAFQVTDPNGVIIQLVAWNASPAV